MHTITSTPTPTDAHHLVFAEALCSYAESERSFAHNLALAISSQQWQVQTPLYPSLTPSQYQKPRDIYSATHLAHWLITTTTPQTCPHTTAYLAAWAREHELPQDLVLGIVGLAIIGPTLGILDKPKKKKKAQLMVVLEETYYTTKSTGAIATTITELAQEIIATELRLAAGNVSRLHPDTAEWTFDAGRVGIYSATSSDLTLLHEAAQADECLYRISRYNNGLRAIAFSPTVDSDILDLITTNTHTK